MQPKDIETLEKAGGLILDQLVATRTISTEQQTQILDQQSRIAIDTGEKPYVGELLEQNGIDTAHIKQPLLDMQASARTLLHAHGEPEAAARAEGGYGSLDLKDGVPDNKWTVKDLESGDPAKERTALLQTRLVQTKVLSTAANMLEANGAEVPAATLTALRASQDAGREGLNAAVKDLQAAGQQPEAVQHTLNAPQSRGL